MSVHLDTHVAAWLAVGDTEKLTPRARETVLQNDLVISPMVLLEFEYMRHKKRIHAAPMELYSFLNTGLGVMLCSTAFSVISVESLPLGWSTDPFDRIIVGTAIADHGSGLVTADRRIRQNYPNAIW